MGGIFSIDLTAQVSFFNVTITDGLANDVTRGFTEAGAIRVSTNAYVRIYDSALINNFAHSYGGAISTVYGGQVAVERSIFSNNRSGGDGGAIHINRGITLNCVRFTQNSASNVGGALSIASTGYASRVSNSSFLTSNSAVNGQRWIRTTGASVDATGSWWAGVVPAVPADVSSQVNTGSRLQNDPTVIYENQDYYNAASPCKMTPPRALPLQPTPTPPVTGIDMLTNGNFNNGLANWTFNGSIQQINSGALLIAPTTPGGGFSQELIYNSAGDNYEITFRARNTSGTTKTLNLMLRDTDWSPQYSCVFTLAGNAPEQFYRMRIDTTESFIPMVLQGAISGDSSLGLQIDDITMFRQPNMIITGTECVVTPPANTNLIYDGTFDQGTTNWAAFNATMNTVNIGSPYGNVMQIGRNANTPDGGFYQYNPYSVPADGSLRFTFQMGNQSNQTRVINMLVRNPDWTDTHSCFITLPPNTGMINFTMTAKPNRAWSNIVIQGWIQVGDYTTGTLPFRFDNLDVRFVPGGGGLGPTICPDPLPTYTPTPSPTLTPTRTYTPTPTPTQVVCVPPAMPQGSPLALSSTCISEGWGLRGDYYSGRNFENYVFTRIDNTIDFDWQSGSPDSRISENNYSVVWTGNIRINSGQRTYRFCTESDDGVRLWVDDQLIINNWTTHSLVQNCGDIVLTGGDGNFFSIRLEYFEADGNATIRLLWQPDTGVRPLPPPYILPGGFLYPSPVQAVVFTPPANYPQAVRVSTGRLREIALEAPEIFFPNDPNPPAPYTRPWFVQIGRTFEATVLAEIQGGIGNVQPNSRNFSSSQRQDLTLNLPTGQMFAVRPDALGDVLLGDGTYYTQSHVIEIKAKTGLIDGGYSSFQIEGMIDIAANSTTLGIAQDIGIVTIISTSNTEISDDILQFATDNRVVFCQAIVFELIGATPHQSRFFVSSAEVLNPEVFALTGSVLIHDWLSLDPVGFSTATVFDPLDPDPISLE
jgi:hypothetical protein